MQNVNNHLQNVSKIPKTLEENLMYVKKLILTEENCERHNE